MPYLRVNRTFVVCLVIVYFYVKSQNNLPDWSHDDVGLSFSHMNIILLLASCVYSHYTRHIDYYTYKIFRTVIIFGTRRVVLCLVTLATIAYWLVVAADHMAVFSWDAVGQKILNRFEENVLYIRENRTWPEVAARYPLNNGTKEPYILHQMYRYPMEDVEMTCQSYKVLWFSGKPPNINRVSWRLNGVPLKKTDRHSLDVHFKELPYIPWPYNEQLLKGYGISAYEVKSTLTIQLLDWSDFGSYTCHVQEINQFVVAQVELQDRNNRTKHGAKQGRTQNVPPPPKKPKSSSFCKCEHAVEIRYQLQDTVTWEKEYRVIPLRRRKDIIRAPPTCILSFVTSHVYMLNAEDGIEHEYLVNDNNFFFLCPDYFNGCSMVLRVYNWIIDYMLSESSWAPPYTKFLPFGFWNSRLRSEHVHCLCGNSYGNHTVKYLRRYFNRTSQQFQLFEVTHPHTLVVLPKDQGMMDLIVNGSSSNIEQKTSGFSKRFTDDFGILRDFAVTAADYFWVKELIVLLVCFIVLLFVAMSVTWILPLIGDIICRYALHGSLAYFSTAMLTTRRIEAPERVERSDQVDNEPYDVFTSVSDAEEETRFLIDFAPLLEERGYKLFVKERDLPPNLQELPALTEAMARSERFILFLSEDYFADRFQRDFEAAIILETLCDREVESNQILVVRRGPCEIPAWLSHLPVHDWTTNLTAEDHVVKLLRWLETSKRRSKLKKAHDAFMSLFPLELVFAVVFACYYLRNIFLEQSVGDQSR